MFLLVILVTDVLFFRYTCTWLADQLSMDLPIFVAVLFHLLFILFTIVYYKAPEFLWRECGRVYHTKCKGTIEDRSMSNKDMDEHKNSVDKRIAWYIYGSYFMFLSGLILYVIILHVYSAVYLFLNNNPVNTGMTCTLMIFVISFVGLHFCIVCAFLLLKQMKNEDFRFEQFSVTVNARIPITDGWLWTFYIKAQGSKVISIDHDSCKNPSNINCEKISEALEHLSAMLLMETKENGDMKQAAQEEDYIIVFEVNVGKTYAEPDFTIVYIRDEDKDEVFEESSECISVFDDSDS
ncbi:uncharacterized protein LOC115092174 [Rhinatrema bivittatum]|uniref:uncharacterized protein LOC115092174 n=1 Tax=Rhinatrema bivittatum TaxID=194408 RepID=UPI00112B6935|nr:uncharacterized protein LOC115092174 [Rhinatrema bivittatum]